MDKSKHDIILAAIDKSNCDGLLQEHVIKNYKPEDAEKIREIACPFVNKILPLVVTYNDLLSNYPDMLDASDTSSVINEYNKCIDNLRAFQYTDSKKDVVLEIRSIIVNGTRVVANLSPIIQAFKEVDGDQEVENAIQISTELNRILVDAKNKSSRIADASAETGASKYANIYSETAAGWKDNAGRWLIASIGVSVSAVFLILCYAIYGASTLSANEIIASLQKINIGVLSLLILLISIAVSFMRSYRSCMHQYTVNLHKVNALKTFQLFYDAANGTDKEIKDAILVQTTRTIFEIGLTGYIAQDSQSNIKNVIDIQKSLKGD